MAYERDQWYNDPDYGDPHHAPWPLQPPGPVDPGATSSGGGLQPPGPVPPGATATSEPGRDGIPLAPGYVQPYSGTDARPPWQQQASSPPRADMDLSGLLPLMIVWAMASLVSN